MSNRYREYAWTGERDVRPPHHLNLFHESFLET
jgi:hypothetical protein